MEQLLAHKTKEALDTITRLTPLLDHRLIPTGGSHEDAYKAPQRPTSKPPCNLTWLGLKTHIEYILRTICHQVRADVGNLYGAPVPTLQGMAGWLTNQHEHLATCMWADSRVWWHITTGEENTSAAEELINHARLLTEALDPPMRKPPAGTAAEIAAILGINEATIRQWKSRGRLQPIGRRGRSHIYSLDKVAELTKTIAQV